MSALYAFCRRVDDVADEENEPVEKRRAALDAWRLDIRMTTLIVGFSLLEMII